MSIKSIVAVFASLSMLCGASVNANGFTESLYKHYHDARNYNFLLGAEIGYSRQKEVFETTFSAPTLVPAVRYNEQTVTMSDKGTILGVLAGWQYHCARWMLGIEGSVDFQQYNRPNTFVFAVPNAVPLIFNATAYYDHGPIWALTARAGYFVTPGFLPYVRLGGQVSRDEANYKVFAGGPLQPINYPGPFVFDFSSVKKNVLGLVAGIGVELPTFIGGTTVRFEYTYSLSERLTIDDLLPPIAGTNEFHHSQTNAIKMAWVWNFCL